MPEENKKASEELIDVGETEGADINFDSKGEPEKQEVVPEETIEVEKVEQAVEEKKEEAVEEKTEEKKDEQGNVIDIGDGKGSTKN